MTSLPENLQLSKDGQLLLVRLSRYYGTSETAVIELLLRRERRTLAEREAIVEAMKKEGKRKFPRAH